MKNWLKKLQTGMAQPQMCHRIIATSLAFCMAFSMMTASGALESNVFATPPQQQIQ